MKHSFRNQAGFTRTELLVTLGVVALIAAIAGTAVVQFRKKSTSYQCKANLKAIGVGMGMYMEDNQQKLPFAFIHFSDSKQLMWDNLIGSYLKSNRRGANASVPATMGSQLLCPADSIAPLPFAVKYGFKRRSYAMPWHTMDPKNWPPDKTTSTGVGLWWATYGGSNSLIRTLNTYTNGIPSIRRDMILSPSMTMLVTEHARSNNIANNTTGARIRYTADHLDTTVIPTESFHRGKFNYLMVDGSALTLYPEDSVGRTGATGDDPKTHKGMWSIRSDD